MYNEYVLGVCFFLERQKFINSDLGTRRARTQPEQLQSPVYCY
jgi:hypothetical protein